MRQAGVGSTMSPMAMVWTSIRNRRQRSVLGRARRWYQYDLERLGDEAVWSDQTRASIARALRTWNVRAAAGTPAAQHVLFWTALGTASIICAVGPFALVWFFAAQQFTAVRVVFAASLYVIIGTSACGMLAAWGMVGRLRFLVTLACRLGGTLSLLTGLGIMTNLLARHDRSDLLPAASFGLLAAVFGLVFALVLQAVARTAASIGFVVTCRLCGSMPPSTLVAVQLFYALATFNDLSGTWKQSDGRKRLLWKLAGRAAFIRHQVPRLQWLVGGSTQVREEAQQRCHRAADLLSHMQWRLAEAHSRRDYDDLRNCLAELVAAAAGGDWTKLADDGSPTRRSRLRSLIRRLATPAILVATAFALPFLPGVAADHSGVTTIQIGLAVAAVLTLASVDSSAQDRVLGALSGIGGHGP
jgi:hypothetical protein